MDFWRRRKLVFLSFHRLLVLLSLLRSGTIGALVLVRH